MNIRGSRSALALAVLLLSGLGWSATASTEPHALMRLIAGKTSASAEVTLRGNERLFTTPNPFLLMDQVKLRSTGTWQLIMVTDRRHHLLFEMLDDASVWDEPLVLITPQHPLSMGTYTITLAGDRLVTADLELFGARGDRKVSVDGLASVTRARRSAQPVDVGPAGTARIPFDLHIPRMVQLIGYRSDVAPAATSAVCLELRPAVACTTEGGRSLGGGGLGGGDVHALMYPRVAPGAYVALADFETAGVATSQGLVVLTMAPANFEL